MKEHGHASARSFRVYSGYGYQEKDVFHILSILDIGSEEGQEQIYIPPLSIRTDTVLSKLVLICDRGPRTNHLIDRVVLSSLIIQY